MKRGPLLLVLLFVAAAHAQEDPLPRGAIARLGSPRLLHSEEVLSVGFTTDGEQILSTSHDGTLRVWDAETGVGKATYRLTHRDEAIAWVETREVVLLSESLSWAARRVEIATGKELGTYPLRPATDHKLTALALDRQGRIVATATREESVVLWDGDKKIATRDLGLVHQLALSPDGSQLLAVTHGVAYILTVGPELKQEHAVKSRAGRCTWAPDGKHFSVASRTSEWFWIYQARTPWHDRMLSGQTLTCLAFAPDGKGIVHGDQHGLIRVATDFEPPTTSYRPITRHLGRVTAVAVAPDGETVASVSFPRTVHFWKGEEHMAFNPHSSVAGVAFTSTGLLAAAGGPGGVTFLQWDWKRHAEKKGSGVTWFRDENTPPADAVACATSGSRFATVSGVTSGELRYWETRTECAATARTSFGLTCVALVGDRVFTGSMDKKVRVWEWGGAKPIGELVGHERVVDAISVSPDGDSVATLGPERIVRVFAARTFELRATLTYKNVTAIAYSRDSRHLALGFGDGSVKVLDGVTHSEKHAWKGHQDGVSCLAWSPDGKRLVSGSRDFTALVWRVGR